MGVIFHDIASLCHSVDVIFGLVRRSANVVADFVAKHVRLDWWGLSRPPFFILLCS